MVGVGGERGHQLRCIFCELETRIDALLLMLLPCGSGSTCGAACVSVVGSQQLAAATAPVLPQFATRHTTPNTQQVREQPIAHAPVRGTLGETLY